MYNCLNFLIFFHIYIHLWSLMLYQIIVVVVLVEDSQLITQL